MTSRELVRLLEKAGWLEVRVKGSHHQYRNTANPSAGTITVPHPRKQLPIGLLRAILKQAGLR